MKQILIGISALSLSLMFLGLVSVTPAAAAPATVSRATLQQYKDWIAEARDQYPYRDSVDKMYRVMMCESVGDRYAVGGGGRWHGLFQYVPGTWRGSWNPYRTSDIYDAKAQIFATAKAWSLGMQNHWSCYSITR